MSGPKCTEVTLSPEALRAIEISRLESRHHQALQNLSANQTRTQKLQLELEALLWPIRTLEAQLRQQHATAEPFQLDFQVPVVQVPPVPEDPKQEGQVATFERDVEAHRLVVEQQERIWGHSIEHHQQLLIQQLNWLRWESAIKHSGESVKPHHPSAYQSPEHQEALRIQERVDQLASPRVLQDIE